MRIERGSTWNVWDFHVHTPYSYLNNKFGFTPTSDNNDDFDNYVRTLLTKAVNKGIVAIGITDYFSIEGYKRIRQEYLSNVKKMKLLFPNNDFREKIERIFIFPNIELRLDTFVGEKSCSVNYHVFFSDDVEVVQYLRKKKHERQIIVVTHNANIVIGTDAEEVIIANQDGDGMPNYSNRFKYRCGAIENISPIYDDSMMTQGKFYLEY